jgi:hypothetical protein
LTVLEFAPTSAPSKAYRKLIAEIIERGEPSRNPDVALGLDSRIGDVDAA